MQRTIIVTLLIVMRTVLYAQTAESPIIIGKKYTIDSKILQEKRTFSVYLPPSYQNNPAKKYFVAYVLDGDKSKFQEVTGIAQSMNSVSHLKMQIPELIIISIDNINRTKDFTPTHALNYLDKEDVAAFESSGKADEFRRFLQQELMPEINKSYRTLPKNMIIGHSLGGLFAIHCLLESPGLFDYYLLIDPSWFWDHNYVGKRTKEVLKTKADLKARVYIALANNFQEDSRHYKWGQEFYETIKTHAAAKLRYFEDEKHLTVPIPATYYGLRFIFDGFETDINEVYKNPFLINEHDREMSEKMGVEIKSDENFINTLGYIGLYDRNIPDVAIAIFEINTQNYPQSLNTWDSLAEAYTVKGLTEKAKRCYEKILSLQPENADAKRKLEKLK